MLFPHLAPNCIYDNLAETYN